MATLTVGAGQAYNDINTAVQAANSGDTINVLAGTYNNQQTDITKDLTIAGVGGLARFTTDGRIGNGKGIFVVDGGNVTLKNLDLSGATVNDGNGAGIRYDSGNLTVVGSYIHNNQDGILANPDATGTIDIENSEIAFNGIGDGYTHNLYIGAIQKFTLNNSYVHDATVGHEVKSRAFNTTITNSRLENNNSNASYVVDAPDGGNVLIQNTVLEKGANAANRPIVHLGGEGGPYAGTHLAFVNDTVVNDYGSGASLVLNQAGAPVTISGGTSSGLSASQINATGTGLTSVAEPVLDATSPAVTTSGADTVVVTVSTDSYRGDPQFQVTVGGQAAGGVLSVGASHALGERRSFTLHGNFGAGAQSVGVQLLNPQNGATADKSRDLYVQGVTYDGAQLTPATAVLTSTTPAVFVSTGSGPTPTPPAPPPAPPTPPPSGTRTLTLALSEDAYQGDAQVALTFDGQSLGTTTVTASHATGGDQILTYTVAATSGAHTLGVSFLNDAYGGSANTDRNLYVDSVKVDGVAQPGTPSALYANGTQNFAVTAGGPPPADDTLVLKLSEDAYQGDAQFIAYVDGVAQGAAQAAFAHHDQGSQQFSLKGHFGAGPHTVQVDFINDAYGGSSSTDRNLYLDGAFFDGTAYKADTAPLYTTSGVTFTVGGGTDPTVSTVAHVALHR